MTLIRATSLRVGIRRTHHNKDEANNIAGDIDLVHALHGDIFVALDGDTVIATAATDMAKQSAIAIQWQTPATTAAIARTIMLATATMASAIVGT